MVVQLFVTLALITSYVGQGVIVALLLRYPLEIILRFEWHFCGFALVCKGLTGNCHIFGTDFLIDLQKPHCKCVMNNKGHQKPPILKKKKNLQKPVKCK